MTTPLPIKARHRRLMERRREYLRTVLDQPSRRSAAALGRDRAELAALNACLAHVQACPYARHRQVDLLCVPPPEA